MGSPPAVSMTSSPHSGWIPASQVRGLPDLRGPGPRDRGLPSRTLTHTQFPYVFADATFCKVRVGAHVVSQALVVATGVSIEGTREVLGTAVGDSESFGVLAGVPGQPSRPAAWPGCIWSSPMPRGLKSAVAQQFSGSSWQRCRVHFMRNLHGAVSAKHAPAVTAAVKTVFAHTDPDEVAAQWDTVADSLAASFPRWPPMMNEAKADVLAFTAFPRAHWQKIWSNNPIERLNKEIKRRR